MTVVSVEKDLEKLTLTFTSEYRAEPDRIWRLWENPRLLEKWWGPPDYPATFVDHDLSAGGSASYFMTGPEGEKYPGSWRVISVDPPTRIELEDVFVDENGEPDPSMPASTSTVSIERDEARDGITLMTIESSFESLKTMETYLEMGAEEGMAAALGQIDGMLADGVV